MKKTLIALAVLAVSGASFAQVSITGNYTAGYRASTGVGATVGANGGDASGLGIDTSALTFEAKEDLGGGMAASAKMSFDGLNRGGVGGGDSGLYLSGGFGKIALENGRGSDYLSGGTSGVGGVGFDDKVFSRLDASDSISYTSPSFGGLTFGVSHDEGAISRANEAASPIGLGVGAAGAPAGPTYQRGTSVTVGYAAGPLAINANYKVWDQQGDASYTSTNSKNRISIRGAYDFGVVKLGAGYRNQQFVTGVRQDSLIAVGIPLGALTLGVDFAQRVHSDTAVRAGVAPGSAEGTRTGYGLKAEYALSKRTSFIANYASWEAAVGVAQRSTETNLLISHSF